MFEKIGKNNNKDLKVVNTDIFALKDGVVSGEISPKKAFEYLKNNTNRIKEIKEQFKTLPQNPEVSKRVEEDKLALIDNMRNVYSNVSKTLIGKMLYKESDFQKVGAFILQLEKEL